eukprot:4062485-Amphidinium_carterae.1
MPARLAPNCVEYPIIIHTSERRIRSGMLKGASAKPDLRTKPHYVFRFCSVYNLPHKLKSIYGVKLIEELKKGHIKYLQLE